jgi:hypothetical protein
MDKTHGGVTLPMNKRQSTLIMAVLLAVIAVAANACASRTTPESTQSTPEEALPTMAQPIGLPPAAWPDEVQRAIDDLAARLGVSAKDIAVASVTKQEMADSTLGCGTSSPRGSVQPTGLVLGTEITLSYGGQDYVYHAVAARLVLCTQSVPAAPGEGVMLPDGSEVALESAVTDLSGMLDIDADAIQVLAVEKRTWSDASLGCPEPGKVYAQVITPGFLIRLEAEGEAYEYHASLNRAILCQ